MPRGVVSQDYPPKIRGEQNTPENAGNGPFRDLCFQVYCVFGWSLFPSTVIQTQTIIHDSYPPEQAAENGFAAEQWIFLQTAGNYRRVSGAQDSRTLANNFHEKEGAKTRPKAQHTRNSKFPEWLVTCVFRRFAF